LASFLDRLVARLLDSLIISGLGSVILIPLFLIVFFFVLDGFGSTVTTSRDPSGQAPTDLGDPFAILLPLLGLVALMFVLIFVMQYLYEVEFMFRTGQTIGKRIMKIRVIPVDPSVTLTRSHAAQRYLIIFFSGLVPGLGWLDGLWQLWDKPYQQCLHDKAPSTLVIKLNS
jgi:uncharacterized RDD family membrane protein YckC